MSYDFKAIRDGIRALEAQEQADMIAQEKISSDERRATALTFIQANILPRLIINPSLSIPLQKARCYENMELLTAEANKRITQELREELLKLTPPQLVEANRLKDIQRTS